MICEECEERMDTSPLPPVVTKPASRARRRAGTLSVLQILTVIADRLIRERGWNAMAGDKGDGRLGRRLRKVESGAGAVAVGEPGDDEAKRLAVKLRRLPDRVAAIVAKTWCCQGDAAPMNDDEALGRIKDILMEDFGGQAIIDRNKEKKLARR